MEKRGCGYFVDTYTLIDISSTVYSDKQYSVYLGHLYCATLAALGIMVNEIESQQVVGKSTRRCEILGRVRGGL